MKQSQESSIDLTRMLAEANCGDFDYNEIIARTSDRLMKLTRSMLKNYVRLRRWEQSDDVFQAAVLRLHRSLPHVQPTSQREFLGLAAAQIRRTLIDLSRHYFGPEGLGAHHHTDHVNVNQNALGAVALAADRRSPKPESLQEWTEFHEAVDRLEPDEREVFQLIWYTGLEQREAAEVLGCSIPTIQRRWYAAQISLYRILQSSPPCGPEST